MRTIDRGRRLALVLAGVVCFSRAAGVRAAGPKGAAATKPPRPNVVVILTDDQRFDTVGTEHARDGVTPVMQAVTAELVDHGVSFSNSFATTALCAPSRASLLAARYAHSTGVIDNDGRDALPAFDDTRTLATWLHDAGYVTGLFGKYINGYENYAPYTPPGWDDWHAFKRPGYFDYTLVENGVEVLYGHAEADYSTDVLAARVVGFIREHAGRQPFFVYFTPFAPHEPAIPAPRHAGSFSGAPPWRPPNYDEADVADKPGWVRDIPPWSAGKIADTDALDRRQLECLQAVDDATAAVMAALRAAGVADDTIVVFASDNGYAWGAHRWQIKQCPYEECMRVPLVVRYPRLTAAPRVEPRIALNIDYAETLAELAGAKIPSNVEGMSLVPLLDRSAQRWRTDFLEEHWAGRKAKRPHRNIPDFAQVRGADWKYTEYTTGEAELYDEQADPAELRNLKDDPARTPVVSRLAARLRVYRPDWRP